jgi:hypothetical protein
MLGRRERPAAAVDKCIQQCGRDSCETPSRLRIYTKVSFYSARGFVVADTLICKNVVHVTEDKFGMAGSILYPKQTTQFLVKEGTDSVL